MTTQDQMTTAAAMLRRAYLTIEGMQRRLAETERARNEPIAVVGIGCRFPGGAVDPDSYWGVLSHGVDAVTEIPKDRWDIDAVYHADPQRPGRMNTRCGGFLDRVDQFDHAFFGISRREAVAMDPQQRLTLEVAWEALEHAGTPPTSLAGSRTGVFMGVCSSDFGTEHFRHPLDITAYASTGTAHSVVTGRLSYLLDLRGPSLAIDSACSSSLVAVQLAGQSLRAGECDLALAGGVNVVVSPLPSIAFSQFPGMVSPDGRCRTFDASANGYVRSEGCGIVVLKRLSDARRDGDQVLAVLRGGAVNSDGRSSGVTAPSGLAQRDVLRRALRASDVEPHEVSYIEAHGTGTSLGDPIEVEALAEVYGRPSGTPVYLGSSKTNIGHAEAAAGIAGLIKVVLALGHDTIPPNVHFERLNPHLSFDGTTFAVPTRPTPWPTPPERRIAGVSSLGFSGTNAHIIVSATAPYPAEPADPEEDPATGTAPVGVAAPSRSGAAPAGDRPLSVLAISAKSETALAALAGRYADRFRAGRSTGERVGDERSAAADICYSASTGRSHLRHRLAVVGASGEEFAAQLAAVAAGRPAEGVTTGTGTSGDVVFLFTGQGPQRAGMAGALYGGQPTFRAAVDRCAEILRPLLAVPLLEVLYPDDPTSDLINETTYAQPALFAVEYALAQLWQSWGVEPVAVLGHSFGEYVAACVAGAMSLEQALGLVVSRARLMATLADTGAMAAVFAPELEVAEEVVEFDGRVSVAAVNGPANTVISGERAAVAALCELFADRGVQTKPLRITTASHSPLIEPILPELRAAAEEVRFSPPRIPLVSNLTGALWPWDQTPDAEYWCRHARRPVQFAAGVATLRNLGYRIFVELGPAPTLTGLISDSAPVTGADNVLLPSLRPKQDDWRALLSTVARLYTSGVDLDWRRFDADHARTRVQLPTYPFDRIECRQQPRRRQPAGWGSAAEEQAVSAAEAFDDELLYRLDWQPVGAASRPTEDRPADAGGFVTQPVTWVLVGGGRGLRDRLADLIAGRGQRCVLLDDSDDLAGVLSGLDPGPDGQLRVVHLGALDVREEEQDTPAAVLWAQQVGCMGAVRVVQALAGGPAAPGTRMWLVTSGAAGPAGTGDGPATRRAHPAVGQATLWGLGRSLQQEHAGCWGGLVDLDPAAEPAMAAEALFEAIEHPDGEDQVAVRDGRRYVARLVRVQVPEDNGGGGPWRPDASYLITGGLGGVGSQVARSMVLAGARHLVLVGRTPLPPRGQWSALPAEGPQGRRVAEVRALEALGASVVVEALDVSDHEAMLGFLDRFDREGRPPIRGVVHAAGTGEVAPVLGLQPADLEEHLRSKVLGAWVLDRLFADRPLDFFVLFSSASSVLSSPFVASYAAANAYLDALATARRAAGRPGLSINWGIWARTGLATRGADATPGLSRGMGTLGPAQAVRLLHRLLGHDGAQIAVVPVDWAEWGRRYQEVSGSRLLAALVDEAPATRRPTTPAARRSALPTRQELLALPAGQRSVALTEALARSVTATMGAGAGAVGPDQSLFDLGLDSFMAVELRNEVDGRLGVTLPIAVLLEGATVRQLADRILDRVGDVEARLLAQLDDLPDEQVLALLNVAGDGRKTP